MHKVKYPTILIILAVSISLTGRSFAVSASPLMQTSPTLGAAGSFSILAETTITNIPTSVVGGDVGLSPATGAGIGLTDAEVAGTLYTVDAAGPAGSVMNPGLLTQAINDMMAAYTTLDQTCTTTYTGVQDLTAVSPLASGIYCADAFLLTGNLTLSGSGVWIFKSAATLTTAVGSSVTGGDACNVWWRLGSAADLFTGSSIRGNILAGTSINMQSGASLNGRALAQAAVTLSMNSISGCTAPSSPATATAAPATIPPTSTSASTVATATAAPATIPPTSTSASTVATATASTSTIARIPPTTTTASTATLPVINGLPNTGAAPIRNEDFPWSLVVFAGISALALVLGVHAYRRVRPPRL